VADDGGEEVEPERHQEVGEARAPGEEQQRRGNEGQGESPLHGPQAGGDERPRLPEDDRQREHQPADHRHLQRDGHQLGGAGDDRFGDEAVVGGEEAGQRVLEDAEQEVVEDRGHDGRDQPGNERDDEDPPEVLEVLDHRHPALFLDRAGAGHTAPAATKDPQRHLRPLSWRAGQLTGVAAEAPSRRSAQPRGVSSGTLTGGRSSGTGAHCDAGGVVPPPTEPCPPETALRNSWMARPNPAPTSGILPGPQMTSTTTRISRMIHQWSNPGISHAPPYGRGEKATPTELSLAPGHSTSTARAERPSSSTLGCRPAPPGEDKGPSGRKTGSALPCGGGADRPREGGDRPVDVGGLGGGAQEGGLELRRRPEDSGLPPGAVNPGEGAQVAAPGILVIVDAVHAEEDGEHAPHPVDGTGDRRR